MAREQSAEVKASQRLNARNPMWIKIQSDQYRDILGIIYIYI